MTFTHNSIFKSGKLFFNDSLVLLYTLSSPTYTITFLAILLGYAVLKLKNKLLLIFFSYTLITLMYFCIPDSNYNYVWTFLHSHNVSTTLQNGLLNIHPVFIYYIYSTTLVFYYYIYRYDSVSVSKEFIRSSLYVVILNTAVGIILGAVWASQELNWGGFWSWDPVELVSLILFFIILVLLHTEKGFIMKGRVFFILMSIIIIYFIIRLGLITSVHSFVRTNNTPIYAKFSLWTIFCVAGTIFIKVSLTRRYRGVQFLSIRYTPYILLVSVYVYIYYLFAENIMVIRTPIGINLAYLCAFILICTLVINSRANEGYAVVLIILSCIFLYIIHPAYVLLYLLVYMFMNYTPFRYWVFHYAALFIYLIFFIFFVTVSIYTIKHAYKSYTHISLTDFSISWTNLFSYDTSFLLEKNIFLNRIKNNIQHTTGFTIYTNASTSVYIFMSNFNLRCLFSIEIIYISYIYWSIVFLWYSIYRSENINYKKYIMNY